MTARVGLIHGGLGAALAGSQIGAGIAAPLGRADMRGARKARR